MKLEYWRLKDNIKEYQQSSENRFTKALQEKVNYIKWLQSKGALTEFQKKAIDKDLALIKAAEEYFGIMHHCLGWALREHDAANEMTTAAHHELNELQNKYWALITERNGKIQPAA